MIYLCVFIIEVIILAIIEKLQWGKWLTPLNVLSLPYTVAVIVAILYKEVAPNIPEFYYPSFIVWIIGLLFFEIPSAFLAKSIRKGYKRKYFSIEISHGDDSYILLRNIAFICIAVSLLKIRSLSGSLDSFGSDDFSSQYQTSGVFNHLSVLLGCIFSYVIYKCDFNHKSSFIIIVGSLIGMYAIGTKSWIIAPMLIGYYARLLTGKTKFNVKTTILPVVIIFGIFFFSYYLSIIVVGGVDVSNEFLLFIGNHFVDYFCGGALTLSLDYKMGFVEPQMTEALFGPLLNIFNAIFGFDYINVVNPIFIDIGDLGSSNVRTFFGTILAYSKSPVLFILLTFIYSFSIYYIYALLCKSNSVFLLLANTSNLTFLTLGFFDFYWLTLSCYEICIIFLVMHYFLYIKKRRIKITFNSKRYKLQW